MKRRQTSPSSGRAKMREPNPLAEVLNAEKPAPPLLTGVLIGKFVGPADDGLALVDFAHPGFRDPVPARSVTPLPADAIGRSVAVVFEQGDPRKPLVMGVVYDAPAAPPEHPLPRQVDLDGEQLVFTADREIVLRCGKSSLTLTKDGKVLIRGAYLLSRSSGVNRIKGGSVQLN